MSRQYASLIVEPWKRGVDLGREGERALPSLSRASPPLNATVTQNHVTTYTSFRYGLGRQSATQPFRTLT